MGLVSQQAKAQWALTEPDPVELPFTEGVAAVFEAGRLTDQSFSTQYQTREALKASMQRLGELGGPKGEVPWPLPDSTANAALDWLDSHKDTIAALRSPDNGPPDPFLKTGEEIRQDVKQRVEEARALASRAGLGAQLVGGMGVGLTDPLNLALLPLGAGAAEGLLVRVATEAGIGTASQSAVELASAGAKERAGVADGLGASAMRVAETAVGAGALASIFHGIGRVLDLRGKIELYRKGVAEGRINPTRATEAAADALQDHIDTVPALPTARAEAAHLEATQAAADVLSASTPESRALAMRALADRTAAWVDAAERIHGESATRLLDLTATARAAGATSEEIARAAAVTAERVGDTIQVRIGGPDVKFGVESIGGRTITLDDPELVRGKWSVSKIQKAIVSRLDDAIAGEQAARAAADEARTVAARLTDQGIGRREGGYFRNPKQAEAARVELGDPSLEVVRVGKQKFVLRPPDSVDPVSVLAYRAETQAAHDAAIAKEAATPTPPVVETPVDAPLTRPVASAEHAAMVSEMRSMAEARPDIRVEVELGDEVLSGNMAEVMARLDQEEAELGDTVDCLLGGLE